MLPSAAPTLEPETGPIVLVVDDSPLAVRRVAQILSDEGFRVETAGDGEQALARCTTRRYAAVISDVNMGAISGVQLCRLLRADPATAEVPLILLTGAEDRKTKFWGHNAGANAYVQKAAVLDDLVPVLRQTIADNPTPAENSTPTGRPDPQPLERLSKVLDALLFEAVVAREARRIGESVDDRNAFVRETFNLAENLTDYAYLVLTLEGVQTSHAVHVRGDWPEETDERALAYLGLTGVSADEVLIVRETDSTLTDDTSRTGEMACFPIKIGTQLLGHLQAFGGTKSLRADDVRTFSLLATELGPVVRGLYLVEETRQLARTDPLTGLANRRRCVERLSEEMALGARYDSVVSVLLCDVDHFKKVNDELGHNVGDEVLVALARTLGNWVRNVDVLGRWGGEEMLVVLPSTGLGGARIVAERLRRAVAAMEAATPVTMSIGVATSRKSDDVDCLVQRADVALYRAKHRGRNRVELETDDP